MASGAWQLTNRSSAGGAATLSEAAPSGASAGGIQVRLRGLQASIEGTSAGVGSLVVRDGATGSGTIIWQEDLIIVANGGTSFAETALDLRASVGKALTVEFTSGVTSAREAINAQGDLVPTGWPYGEP